MIGFLLSAITDVSQVPIRLCASLGDAQRLAATLGSSTWMHEHGETIGDAVHVNKDQLTQRFTGWRITEFFDGVPIASYTFYPRLAKEVERWYVTHSKLPVLP